MLYRDKSRGVFEIYLQGLREDKNKRHFYLAQAFYKWPTYNLTVGMQLHKADLCYQTCLRG